MLWIVVLLAFMGTLIGLGSANGVGRFIYTPFSAVQAETHNPGITSVVPHHRIIDDGKSV